MLRSLEKTLIDLKPEWVLVYGDTNSTIAGVDPGRILRSLDIKPGGPRDNYFGDGKAGRYIVENLLKS